MPVSPELDAIIRAISGQYPGNIRALRAGVRVTVEGWPGMIHGWHGLVNAGIPEASSAWLAIKQYMGQQLPD